MAKVVVLGAGVSGLTSAIRLLEEGHSVEIWAKAITPNTTSDVAAALWWSFHAEPADRVMSWSTRSFRVFEQLSTDSATGVCMRTGVLALASNPPPERILTIPGTKVIVKSELPAHCSSAVRMRAPMIEMNRYMPWLLNRVKALGGQVREQAATSFIEVSPFAEVIVNATGLGAQELTGDTELYPVRGRVVRVEQVGVEEFFGNEAGVWPTHILPRQKDIVLGGTYEENVTELEVPPSMDDEIVERCIAIEPRLATARRISGISGLRPARSTIRLELDSSGDGPPVVHNYGHGGAGVTVSWGCAEEVASLVAQQ
ncbi:MAG: FAD-dependent oxidoreductase [Candidatus Dormibacteraceae bacterium]